MALSIEHRNLATYKYLIMKFAKLETVKFFIKLRKYCFQAGFSETEYEKMQKSLIQSIDTASCDGTFTMPSSDVLEMAWKVVKYHALDTSIRLGDVTRREIGGIAKELGLCPDDALELAGLVTLEVSKTLFPTVFKNYN